MWAVIILFAVILVMFMSAAYTEISNLKEAINILSFKIERLERDVKAINENINLIEYGDIEKG